MTLLDLTSCDDIRAALGVSEDELTDATISLPLYENGLIGALEDLADEVGADASGAIDTVIAKAPADRSADEARLARAAQAFATYSTARVLCTTLPLFSPKDITDGKAAISRFAQDPYKEVIKGVAAQYEVWRTRLAKAVAAINQSTVAAPQMPTLFSIVSPSSDPVTGT